MAEIEQLMPDSSTILRELDARAARFEFPVLDNANVHFIGGRFRGLSSQRGWLMLFEILVFDPVDRAIVADVYAYGAPAGPTGFRLFQSGGLDPDPDHPWWDAEGNWIVEPSGTTVRVGGRLRRVGLRGRDSSDIQVQRADLANEIEFGRALLKTCGFEELVPSREVDANLDLSEDWRELFRLGDWDHPDVAGGERPSDSVAIRAGASVLCGESALLFYRGENANLNSERWAAGP